MLPPVRGFSQEPLAARRGARLVVVVIVAGVAALAGIAAIAATLIPTVRKKKCSASYTIFFNLQVDIFITYYRHERQYHHQLSPP